MELFDSNGVIIYESKSISFCLYRRHTNTAIQSRRIARFMCASLAKGKSIISNIAYSDDILATIAGMRALGAAITMEKNTVVIEGIQSLPQTPLQVDCNESGSTLRFFVPLFTLSGQPITFLGRNRFVKASAGSISNNV